MPDLWLLRRMVLPAAEKIDKSYLGNAIKFSFPVQEKEYVRVLDMPVSDARDLFRGMENVYSNNLAALKYTSNGTYDAGSYAHRPEGFFGTYQTHFRLFPQGDLTAVYAHYEYNPWAKPVKHYNSKEWSAEKGVENAEVLLSKPYE